MVLMLDNSFKSITFGNGTKASLGCEMYRETLLFAELDVCTACMVASGEIRQSRERLQAYNDKVTQYCNQAGSLITIIGAACNIYSSTIVDAYIGKGTLVENYCVISNSSLLGYGSRVSGNVCIRNSLIQECCSLENGSLVEASLMCVKTHTERHAKVTESIIGITTL